MKKYQIDKSGINHIAIVVNDLEKAVAEWGRLFGIEKENMNIRLKGDNSAADPAHAGERDPRTHWREDYNYGDGPDYEFLEADIDIDCMRIELIQATGKKGPFAEYYRKHGTGIHHIAFRENNWTEANQRLLDEGFSYRVETYAPNNDSWNVMDTEEVFGTNICIKPPLSDLLVLPAPHHCTMKMQKGHTIDGNCIIHIALVVHDVIKAAKAWSDLTGEPIEEMNIRTKGYSENTESDGRNHYRSDYSYGKSPGNAFKEADVHMPGFIIELIEPEENGPFREYYDKHGTGIHHIAFRVGDECTILNDQLINDGYSYIVDTYAPNGDRWPVIDTAEVLGTNLCIKPGTVSVK